MKHSSSYQSLDGRTVILVILVLFCLALSAFSQQSSTVTYTLKLGVNAQIILQQTDRYTRYLLELSQDPEGDYVSKDSIVIFQPVNQGTDAARTYCMIVTATVFDPSTSTVSATVTIYQPVFSSEGSITAYEETTSFYSGPSQPLYPNGLAFGDYQRIFLQEPKLSF